MLLPMKNKSFASCNLCHTKWDPSISATCPSCLARRWASKPDLIKKKHNPLFLPNVEKIFRSVVTYDFIYNQEEFLKFIAVNGSCYYSIKDKTYNLFAPYSLGSVSGSAIPANYPMPTYPLDGLYVANAYGDSPHVYAQDSAYFYNELKTGKFIELQKCDEDGCFNYVIPGLKKCIFHSK